MGANSNDGTRFRISVATAQYIKDNEILYWYCCLSAQNGSSSTDVGGVCSRERKGKENGRRL